MLIATVCIALALLPTAILNADGAQPVVSQNSRDDAKLAPRSSDGDRILVKKLAYDTSDGKDWDVTIFKYPSDFPRNYIKRLIGLPGETVVIEAGQVRLAAGDVFDTIKTQGAKIEITRDAIRIQGGTVEIQRTVSPTRDDLDYQ